jgi:hypothetical protein
MGETIERLKDRIVQTEIEADCAPSGADQNQIAIMEALVELLEYRRGKLVEQEATHEPA